MKLKDMPGSNYRLIVPYSLHGTVTLTNPVQYTTKGTTVSGKVTADSGYKLQSLKYNDTLITPAGDGTFSFTMPDKAVTLTAKFITSSGGKGTPTAPAAGTGYIVNYDTETLVAASGYEVSSSGSQYTPLVDNKVEPGVSYYVRTEENDVNGPSAWTTVSIPARPAASAAPTLESKTDTAVTVTAAPGQEYSVDGGKSWISDGGAGDGDSAAGTITFSGLIENTKYDVITRTRAVATPGSESFASSESPASVITTKSSTPSTAAADPIDIVNGEVLSGGNEVEIKDDSGKEISAGELAKDVEAVNKVLDNKTVKDFGKTADDTGLIKGTEPSNSDIVERLKAQTDDAVAESNVNEKDISKYLNVTLVSANVDTTANIIVTSVTFDVTPMATTTVTGSDGQVTLTTEILNDEISDTVTFLLPVDKNVTAKKAAVYHEGEFLGNYEIKTAGNGDKYLEISTTSFSKFTYIILDEKTAGAKIGDELYATLSDAVSEVNDNKTVTLLKDASDTITVSRTVKFTVDTNGKTNDAQITAGSGFTLSKSGNTYTVSENTGAGGSGYEAYVPTTASPM